MSDRKPTSNAPTVVVLVLLAMYVGAYYATVSTSMPFVDGPGNAFWPVYRLGSRVAVQCRILFAPVHWLDRRIRPQFWQLDDMRRAVNTRVVP